MFFGRWSFPVSSITNFHAGIGCMMIDRESLAQTFTSLCEIDSPSKKEGQIASYLKRIMSAEFPSAELVEDGSSAVTGSDSGNLIIRFPGTLDLEPVFFNCHMDTVEPACGVKVKRDGDIFSSAGDTVLGGDDKAGIAILLEMMRYLQRNNIPHGPVELVFTTCEEIGLLGAKALEHGLVKAKMGYALDSTGTDNVVLGAPSANHFRAQIKGLAAHAGLRPEEGINAIQLAARAISQLRLGRLDQESTANIGKISGGTATNIVPDLVKIEGEVRSHSTQKLAQYTESIQEAFAEIVNSWKDPRQKIESRPELVFETAEEYPVLKLDREAPVVRRISRAAERLERSLEYIIAGGGSDANIFNGYGLQTPIVGIGMKDVHTIDESISLQDMVRTAELLISIVTS